MGAFTFVTADGQFFPVILTTIGRKNLSDKSVGRSFLPMVVRMTDVGILLYSGIEMK
jgi:hypothetical protein